MKEGETRSFDVSIILYIVHKQIIDEKIKLTARQETQNTTLPISRYFNLSNVLSQLLIQSVVTLLTILMQWGVAKTSLNEMVVCCMVETNNDTLTSSKKCHGRLHSTHEKP